MEGATPTAKPLQRSRDSPASSTVFKELYESVQCRYHPVRLYQDGITSPLCQRVSEETERVHPFERGAHAVGDVALLTVVRVTEPAVPDASPRADVRGTGALEILSPRRPIRIARTVPISDGELFAGGPRSSLGHAISGACGRPRTALG